MGNYTDKLKRYFGFSQKEILGIIIAIVFCALVFSIDMWGYTAAKGTVDLNDRWVYVLSEDEENYDVLDYRYGLSNLFYALLIAVVTILIHHTIQRMLGIAVGFKPEHKLLKLAILASVILALFSNGFIKFMAPTGLMLYHLTKQRLGEFKYGLNFWTLGYVGLFGPISAVMLAIIFKVLLSMNPENIILESAMMFNLWFAASNLLPIPPIDGSHMFYASRPFYVFSSVGLLAVILLLAYVSVLVSLIIGFLIGAGIFWLYFAYVEK